MWYDEPRDVTVAFRPIAAFEPCPSPKRVHESIQCDVIGQKVEKKKGKKRGTNDEGKDLQVSRVRREHTREKKGNISHTSAYITVHITQ